MTIACLLYNTVRAACAIKGCQVAYDKAQWAFSRVGNALELPEAAGPAPGVGVDADCKKIC